MINWIVQPKSQHIVMLLFCGNQFAVLEMCLDKCEFFIYNGHDVNGTNTKQHITHIVTTIRRVVPICGKGGCHIFCCFIAHILLLINMFLFCHPAPTVTSYESMMTMVNEDILMKGVAGQ